MLDIWYVCLCVGCMMCALYDKVRSLIQSLILHTYCGPEWEWDTVSAYHPRRRNTSHVQEASLSWRSHR